jgi:hypothetical protein
MNFVLSKILQRGEFYDTQERLASWSACGSDFDGEGLVAHFEPSDALGGAVSQWSLRSRDFRDKGTLGTKTPPFQGEYNFCVENRNNLGTLYIGKQTDQKNKNT